MNTSSDLETRQAVLFAVVQELGKGATAEQVRDALPKNCGFEAVDLLEVLPLVQEQLFGASHWMPPSPALRPASVAASEASRQRAPSPAPERPQAVRDDSVMFDALVSKMTRYGATCAARRSTQGLEISLGQGVSVRDCQPLLSELGIEPASKTSTSFVVRAADAAKLDEHLDSEAALLNRIGTRLANDLKDSKDTDWNVEIRALAPGVYEIAHPAQPEAIRMKAGYSLHTVMRQVESRLHAEQHPNDKKYVPPGLWDAQSSAHSFTGRRRLNVLDEVLNGTRHLKGMLDVALQNARLSRPEIFENAHIEVSPVGSKPLCDFLQKAQAKDARNRTNTFAAECEKLDCKPADVLRLQQFEGQVSLPGAVQLRTDSAVLKTELEAIFRALNLKSANGQMKEFIDPMAAATMQPNRFICNLGWFEPPIIAMYFSLSPSQANLGTPITRHGQKARFFGTPDEQVDIAREILAQSVRNTAKDIIAEGKRTAMLGDVFDGQELAAISDLNAITPAVANDVYTAASEFFTVSNAGLRVGHDTLKDADRLALCYGPSAFKDVEIAPSDEAQRLERLDALEEKLLGSPTLSATAQAHPGLRGSIQGMFVTARDNNRKVGAKGGGASFYSLELMNEAIQNIEVITARVVQAEAGRAKGQNDCVERFALQMSEIGDLWPGCTEGLAQKTRPLVAAINASTVSSDKLDAHLAEKTAAYLETYVTHCQRVQNGSSRISRNESSMGNVVGAFDHVIGRAPDRAAGSGWGLRGSSIGDSELRCVLKENIHADTLVRTLVEKEFQPELNNIRSAWEAGKAVHLDWEALLDSLSLGADEKVLFRASDEYMIESVPRFNKLEWMLPILTLRHLKSIGIVERRPGNLDTEYGRFIREFKKYGGITKDSERERADYGKSTREQAEKTTPYVE